MKTIARAVFFILLLSAQCLYAQRRPIPSGGGDPPPPSPPPAPPPTVTCPISIGPGSAVTAPWGFYFWQVDLNPSTTTLTSEMDFSTTPTGLVQIQIPSSGNLPCVATVHEVHGNVTLEAQQGGSCRTNSVVAQVRDQSGNVIASALLLQFGPSAVNVPIKGTFSTPLSVSQFVLQFNVNPGCSSALSWSLTMS